MGAPLAVDQHVGESHPKHRASFMSFRTGIGDDEFHVPIALDRDKAAARSLEHCGVCRRIGARLQQQVLPVGIDVTYQRLVAEFAGLQIGHDRDLLRGECADDAVNVRRCTGYFFAGPGFGGGKTLWG